MMEKLKERLELLHFTFAKYEIFDLFDTVSCYLADLDLYQQDAIKFEAEVLDKILKDIRHNIFPAILKGDTIKSIATPEEIANLRWCLFIDSKNLERICQAYKTATAYLQRRATWTHQNSKQPSLK